MRKSNYGSAAESFVCAYLENEGYSILKRNFRIRGAEIDVIAAKGDYICFVEIKYRTSGSGLETAIERKQQRRIIFAAEEFLRKTGCMLQPRFDAAFLSAEDGGMSLEYISNAFDGGV